jgi:hypothetical protein
MLEIRLFFFLILEEFGKLSILLIVVDNLATIWNNPSSYKTYFPSQLYEPIYTSGSEVSVVILVLKIDSKYKIINK